MMYFELRAGSASGTSGLVTHAAALEFTAAEGTVGLPPLLAGRLGATPLLPSEATTTTTITHAQAQAQAASDEVAGEQPRAARQATAWAKVVP